VQVGYGDIFPRTEIGRIAAIFLISSAVITVPRLTQELIETMARQSIYVRAAYHPKSTTSRHVLVCGNLSSTFLEDFFYELFHEDHDTSDIDAVLLNPHPPDYQTIELLSHHAHYNVYYLQGSALKEEDLNRAQADRAIAIIILTNKFTAHADEEDSETIMHQFSIKRFISQSNPLYQEYPPLFCTQLIRPENERHLFGADDINRAETDVVVCLNQIKMGILAKSALFPGVCTLIMNVVTSITVDDEASKQLGLKAITTNLLRSISTLGDRHRHPNDLDDDDLQDENFELANGRDSWLVEYLQGCDWEVYTTELSDMFEGAKFVEVSYLLYEKLGVVLFGLRITDIKNGHIPPRLLLNPYNYYIPSKKDCYIEAFVFAKNKAASDLTFTPKEKADGTAEDNRTGFSVASIQSIALALQSVPKRGSYTASQAHINPLNPRKSFENGGPSTHTGGMNDRAVRPSIMALNFFARRAESNNQIPNPHSAFFHRSNLNASHRASKVGWNKYKKQSIDFTRLEHESEQEHLHRLEEEHFEKHYLLRATPLDLHEVRIKTSVTQEIPNINNHIIIMGKGINNIFDLIRPLRAKYLGKIKHIVILYPHDIPHNIWQRIAIFDAIVFVRGSHLEENDIRRAGIFRAQQVVVLADVHSSESAMKNVEAESLADSDAIFCYQCVKRLNPDAHIVIEIVKQSNIGYLDINDASTMGKRRDDYRFSPRFAAGSVFTTSALDTLVCQAFHNPQIVEVVHRLVSGIDQVDRNELIVRAALQSMATDGAGAPDDEDLIPEVMKLRGSALYQMDIPEGIKTYERLYKYLASKDMIPLGILRGVFPQMLIGPRGNKSPYVFTNPEKGTTLYACDKVFVLSPNPIQIAKGNMKEMIMDIQIQHRMNHLNRGSSEDDHIVGRISEVLEGKIESMAKKITKRVMKAIGGKLEGSFEDSDSLPRLQRSDDSDDEDEEDEDELMPSPSSDKMKAFQLSSSSGSGKSLRHDSPSSGGLLDEIATIRPPWSSSSPSSSGVGIIPSSSPRSQQSIANMQRFAALKEEEEGDDDDEEEGEEEAGGEDEEDEAIQAAAKIKPISPSSAPRSSSRISLRVLSSPSHERDMDKTMSISSIYPDTKDDFHEDSPSSRHNRSNKSLTGPPVSVITPKNSKRRLVPRSSTPKSSQVAAVDVGISPIAGNEATTSLAHDIDQASSLNA
jgi:hypothetical protein